MTAHRLRSAAAVIMAVAFTLNAIELLTRAELPPAAHSWLQWIAAGTFMTSGLVLVLAELLRRRTHEHRWEDSAANPFGFVAEQRCSCGARQHRLLDLRRPDWQWMPGPHPARGEGASTLVPPPRRPARP